MKSTLMLTHAINSLQEKSLVFHTMQHVQSSSVYTASVSPRTLLYFHLESKTVLVLYICTHKIDNDFMHDNYFIILPEICIVATSSVCIGCCSVY